VKKIWEEASRREEVREAASGWKEAGAIDGATLAAIEAEYPASGRVLAPVWRVLIFLLVSVAVNALFWVVFAFGSSGTMGPGAMAYGAVLAVAAEALRSSRLQGTGAPAAAAFWAVLYLTIGLAVFLMQNLHFADGPALTLSIACAAVAFGLSGARWGYAAQGVLSAVALFLFLARFPQGRLLWVAAGVLVLVAAARRLDRREYAPPHRRALEGILAVGAVAIYAAVNLFSFDRGFVERLSGLSGRMPLPPAIARVVSAAATALVPVGFLVWGLKSRRRTLLRLGALFAVLSLATLGYYAHLEPLWLVLGVSGSALILGALALNRLLRSAPGAERGGYTASPLYSGIGPEGLSTAAAVAGFAPDVAPAPESRSGEFSPGGGRFGGGGASGSFD
jgi:hypothetical protein